MAREAYEAALRGVDFDLPATASPARPRPNASADAAPESPVTDSAPPTPVSLTLLSSQPVVGADVVVPSTIWPRYRCRELGGAGWAVRVLSSTAHTAVVRFLHARTHDGRPYSDERLPWNLLSSRTN